MSEKQRLRIIANSDNEHLGPMLVGQAAIGYVDQVNGEGAEEIAAFVPTRHELRQLARYWMEEDLERAYFWFVTGETGSTDIRLRPYARRRISRIAASLGDEEIEKVTDEIRSEFKEKMGPWHWDIFTNGDEKQWEEVRDEFHRQATTESPEESENADDKD